MPMESEGMSVTWAGWVPVWKFDGVVVVGVGLSVEVQSWNVGWLKVKDSWLFFVSVGMRVARKWLKWSVGSW